MSWQVIITDTAAADLAEWSDAEKDELNEALFGWVDSGPSRSARRVVGGIVVFEDQVADGSLVTYIVNEDDPYVALVRIRRPQ